MAYNQWRYFRLLTFTLAQKPKRLWRSAGLMLRSECWAEKSFEGQQWHSMSVLRLLDWMLLDTPAERHALPHRRLNRYSRLIAMMLGAHSERSDCWLRAECTVHQSVSDAANSAFFCCCSVSDRCHDSGRGHERNVRDARYRLQQHLVLTFFNSDR